MRSQWKTLRVLGILLLGIAASHCGGGSSSGDATDSAASESDGTAENTAARVLDEGIMQAISAISAGESGASRVVAKTDESDYTCTYDEAGSIVTCSCPGGGEMTQHLDGSIDVNDDDEVIFNVSHHTVFDKCVVNSCGDTQLVSGEIEGILYGVYYSDDAMDITVQNSTAEDCSGLSINDVELGFSMTEYYEDGDESVFGTICSGDEMIEFDSFEELEQQTDSTTNCSADAETPEEDETSEEESDSSYDDYEDDDYDYDYDDEDYDYDVE